jgi:WD40 repeat protein
MNTRACRVLQNHLSAVTALTFVDGGNGLVSVGRDKVVNLWSLLTHSLTRTIPVFEVPRFSAPPLMLPLEVIRYVAAAAPQITNQHHLFLLLLHK